MTANATDLTIDSSSCGWGEIKEINTYSGTATTTLYWTITINDIYNDYNGVYLYFDSCGSNYDTYLYLNYENGTRTDTCYDNCGNLCGMAASLSPSQVLHDGVYTLA
eukprot:399567_1